MLKRGGVPASKIYVFVANKEQHATYEEALEKDSYSKLIVGKLGIVNQRDFISSYFPKGQHIVSFDDDIKAVTRLNNKKQFVPMSNLGPFFTEAFNEAKKVGANIWSVYASGNGLWASKAPPIGTGLLYMCGGLFGYVNSKDPAIKLRNGDFTEDKERSLRYFLRDRVTLRFNHYSIKTIVFTPGGLDSPTRRKGHEEGSKRLAAEFPEYMEAIYKPKFRGDEGLWDLKFKKIKEPISGGSLPPANDITEEDRNNRTISTLKIRNQSKYDAAKEKLLAALHEMTVPKIPQPSATSAHHNRGNKLGTNGRTITFGFGDTRHGWKNYATNAQHPDVYRSLVEFGNQVVPKGWTYEGITLNHNVKAKKHTDSKNIGGSVIIGIGPFTGGAIRVWSDEKPTDHNLHDQPVMFNGGLLAHETQPFKGDRYTMIFYKQQRRPRTTLGIGSGSGLADYDFPTYNGGIFA